jgi:hypothetical protein
MVTAVPPPMASMGRAWRAQNIIEVLKTVVTTERVVLVPLPVILHPSSVRYRINDVTLDVRATPNRCDRVRVGEGPGGVASAPCPRRAPLGCLTASRDAGVER